MNSGSSNYLASYNIWDCVIPLITLLVLILLVSAYARIRMKKDPSYRYLLYSFGFVVFGSIISAMVYGLYYKYGDTFRYFVEISSMRAAFLRSPSSLFSILHPIGSSTVNVVYNTGFLISLLLPKSYLSLTLIFSMFGLVGNWLIYRVFLDQYPTLSKQLAYGILYLPSVWFWGVGLLKEPLVMFSIGVFVYTFYYLFIKREFKWWFLIIIPIAYCFFYAKLYLLFSVIFLFVIWLFASRLKKVKSTPIKFIFGSAFLLALVLALISIPSEAISKLFLIEPDLVQTAVNKATYGTKQTLRNFGSGYELGKLEPTLKGLAKLSIPAINVSLFRPYLWECSKVINLFTAFESLFLFLFFLVVVIRSKIFGIFRILFRNPFLLSSACFVLLVSFLVGFISMNFGTLARYRLPVLPFFCAILIIMNSILRESAKERAAQRKMLPDA